jgi:hypothetical protein
LIVNRLEHPKEAGIRLVEGIVLWIVTRHNSANDFAVAPSEKKRGITVLIKRMFLAIEKLFTLEQEWRYPSRIVCIYAPGKFYKGVTFRARTDLADFDSGHAALISASGAVCKAELALQQWRNRVIASAL